MVVDGCPAGEGGAGLAGETAARGEGEALSSSTMVGRAGAGKGPSSAAVGWPWAVGKGLRLRRPAGGR